MTNGNIGFETIDVVETAYLHELEEGRWIETLSRQLSQVDEEILGACAYLYSVHPGEGVEVGVRAYDAIEGEFIDGLATNLRTAPEAVARYSIPGAIATDVRTGAAMMPSEEDWEDWEDRVVGAFPYETALVMQAYEPVHGRGINVTLVTRSPVESGGRLLETASMLAFHLGSGFRLRETAGQGGPAMLGAAEAIFDADGAIRHVAGEAEAERDALRDLVRRLDRIRARKVEAEGALEMWEALARGRWSLVDAFDTDTRRFVVAVRNSRELAEPSALNPRERRVVLSAALGHTNKLIAYEQGIPESTVASLVARGMRKLRIGSRAELVSVLNLVASTIDDQE